MRKMSWNHQTTIVILENEHGLIKIAIFMPWKHPLMFMFELVMGNLQDDKTWLRLEGNFLSL